MVLHMMMDTWSVVTNAGKILYTVSLLFLNAANLWVLILKKTKSLLKKLMNAFFDVLLEKSPMGKKLC